MERKINVVRKNDSRIFPETKLDVEQACNEFQLVGTTRWHVLKKFKGQVNSANDWTEIFREQGIV